LSERTILVVDDNLDHARSVAALLVAHGRAARSAVSVREALDILDDDPSIVLVISDVRMPGVDGFDFMRVLRHRFPALPVVLMSGDPVTDDDVVPRDAEVLVKPLVLQRLLDAVARRL